MNAKLLAVGIIFLMGASALPHTMAHSIAPSLKKLDTIWSDNFDTYQNGQLLNGTSDDGGWKGWDNNTDAHGTVTDQHYRSGPYSNKIQDESNNVHEYDIESGVFTYTAWQYIPTNFTGVTYFILLSNYYDGGDENC